MQSCLQFRHAKRLLDSEMSEQLARKKICQIKGYKSKYDGVSGKNVVTLAFI